MLGGVGVLLDLLVPSGCAGCGVAGPALCSGCGALLAGAPSRVRLPGTDPPVYALGRYRGPLRETVLAYKERGRRELSRPLGAALSRALLSPALPGALSTALPAVRSPALPAALSPALPVADPAAGLWLVPVPSRAFAVRRRGTDHVRALAETTAAALAARGVPAAVAPALKLARGARDSVGLDAPARAANLSGRIRPRAAGLPPPGTSVVLLDDVATTGATLAACAAALSAAGVHTMIALVIAAAAPLLQTGDLRNHSVIVGTHRRTVRRQCES